MRAISWGFKSPFGQIRKVRIFHSFVVDTHLHSLLDKVEEFYGDTSADPWMQDEKDRALSAACNAASAFYTYYKDHNQPLSLTETDKEQCARIHEWSMSYPSASFSSPDGHPPSQKEGDYVARNPLVLFATNMIALNGPQPGSFYPIDDDPNNNKLYDIRYYGGLSCAITALKVFNDMGLSDYLYGDELSEDDLDNIFLVKFIGAFDPDNFQEAKRLELISSDDVEVQTIFSVLAHYPNFHEMSNTVNRGYEY